MSNEIVSNLNTEFMWKWKPGDDDQFQDQFTFLTPRIEDEEIEKYIMYGEDNSLKKLDSRHLETKDVTERYKFLASKWMNEDFRIVDRYQQIGKEIPSDVRGRMFLPDGGEYRVYLMRKKA